MADKEPRLTIWYEEMDAGDYPLVGRKNANLGEMINAGVPVAPGFCLTTHANDVFMAESGIGRQLEVCLPESAPVTFDMASEASGLAVSLMEQANLPPVLEDALLSSYRQLCAKCGVPDAAVAVRSSGTLSIPGHMETYLNVRGGKDLIVHVKKCWASAYSVEAIMYRVNNGMPFLFNIGVGIPKMVKSRVSGTVFTINPLNGDLSRVSIDASYGVGEAVLSAIVTPDTYLIDKATLEPISTTIGTKEVECVYREGVSEAVKALVPRDRRLLACLSREEVLELARIGKLIEAYCGLPYDVEFAIDADMRFPENIIVLQVRAEMVWGGNESIARTKKNNQDNDPDRLHTGVKLK
jgi:pyruvate,water dikinase